MNATPAAVAAALKVGFGVEWEQVEDDLWHVCREYITAPCLSLGEAIHDEYAYYGGLVAYFRPCPGGEDPGENNWAETTTPFPSEHHNWMVGAFAWFEAEGTKIFGRVDLYGYQMDSLELLAARG